MWSRGSRRAPDDGQAQPHTNREKAVLQKQCSVNNTRSSERGCFGFVMGANGLDSSSSSEKHLKHLGNKMVSAMRSMFGCGGAPPAPAAASGRAKPLVAQVMDSHRSKAIDDCIEFINSSSSLQRSNSVPS